MTPALERSGTTWGEAGSPPAGAPHCLQTASLPALQGAVLLFLDHVCAAFLASIFSAFPLLLYIKAGNDTKVLRCPHPDVLVQDQKQQKQRGETPGREMEHNKQVQQCNK